MSQDLLTCAKCNKVFSSKLGSCLYCGATNVRYGCLGVFGLVVVLVIIGFMSGSDKSGQSATPSTAAEVAKSVSVLPPQTAIMALTAVKREDGMLIVGRTNLPLGTQMLVNIEQPSGATLAQDNATVGEFGRFYGGSFATDGSIVPDGTYIVHVVAAIADVQPDNIKAAIGKDWANFLGPLKRPASGVIGPVIEVKWPIEWTNNGQTEPVPTVLPKGKKMPQANAQWAADAEASRGAARAAAWQQKREDAFYACQTFIKRSLRDPSSADFMTEYNETLVSKSGSGGYLVEQQVRANNGFGGKTASIFECETHLSGSDWEADEVKKSN